MQTCHCKRWLEVDRGAAARTTIAVDGGGRLVCQSSAMSVRLARWQARRFGGARRSGAVWTRGIRGRVPVLYLT